MADSNTTPAVMAGSTTTSSVPFVTTTGTTTAVPVSGAAEPQPEPKKDDLPPEVRKALREANKEAETLRLKLKEIEDKDKTELQRLIERVETAEKERDALRLDTMRANVALTVGLPATLAGRLQGSTVEEMRADAEQLLSLLPAPTTDARPRGDVDQGVRSIPLNGDEIEMALRKKLGIS